MKLFFQALVFFKSFFKSFFYFILTLISNKNGVDETSPICIMLTTYNKRLPFVFLTIESLLRQKYKPYKIILVLSYKDCTKEKLPYFIKKQTRRGLEVVFVEENHRSYKKLSYVSRCDLKSLDYIVTVDDDVFYPNFFIETFALNLTKYPNDILCFRGRCIEFLTETEVSSYSTWALATKKNIYGNNLIPTGVSGVCYPIDSITEVASDFENINSLCPHADDIWFKLMTTKNGYNSTLVSTESLHFLPIITGFQKGLEKINVGKDLNTEQFNKSLKFFSLTRKDFQ